eukprot:GEMP01126600.1.p2 GENE.GEMP01126600.1~~GEMP01126600.1.p2  ORF type:complete len:122 (+),score=18.73 GEMP01126600.1:145-510(+)
MASSARPPHADCSISQRYGQKWTWKMVDDQIRRMWGLDEDVANTPFVFHGDRAYFRQYDGHRDVYQLAPAKKRYNFSFFPTNTKDPHSKVKGVVERSDIFGAVLTSAFKVDLASTLASAVH